MKALLNHPSKDALHIISSFMNDWEYVPPAFKQLVDQWQEITHLQRAHAKVAFDKETLIGSVSLLGLTFDFNLKPICREDRPYGLVTFSRPSSTVPGASEILLEVVVTAMGELLSTDLAPIFGNASEAITVTNFRFFANLPLSLLGPDVSL